MGQTEERKNRARIAELEARWNSVVNPGPYKEWADARIAELEAEADACTEHAMEDERRIAELERELREARDGTWDEVYQDRIIALEHAARRYREALERIAATPHDDMCPDNFGGPCECHIAIARQALEQK